MLDIRWGQGLHLECPWSEVCAIIQATAFLKLKELCTVEWNYNYDNYNDKMDVSGIFFIDYMDEVVMCLTLFYIYLFYCFYIVVFCAWYKPILRVSQLSCDLFSYLQRLMWKLYPKEEKLGKSLPLTFIDKLIYFYFLALIKYKSHVWKFYDAFWFIIWGISAVGVYLSPIVSIKTNSLWILSILLLVNRENI